jgi:hypothetical protein
MPTIANDVTIYDLLHAVPEAELLEACAATDPKDAHHYPGMVAELKTIPPKWTDMTVVIQCRRNGDVGDVPEIRAPIDVFAETPGNDCASARASLCVIVPSENEPDAFAVKWAIHVRPWEEFLGSRFRVEGADLSPAQILAECLNEMSWGYWTYELHAAYCTVWKRYVAALQQENGERRSDIIKRAFSSMGPCVLVGMVSELGSDILEQPDALEELVAIFEQAGDEDDAVEAPENEACNDG